MTVLIDGSGFAKAAYVPKQAALCHRFLSRVFQLRRDKRGENVVVAWDTKDNVSGRRARFPEYKANRGFSAFDEEYVEQITELWGLLHLLGVHQAWSDGWEADDVLGTLARLAKDKVYLLTRDRDLLQLVSDKVTVLLKVGSTEHLLNPSGASKFLGFPIETYTEWKTLAGDGGDGVPGIEGIGEKTATALLAWRPTLVEDLLTGRFWPGPGGMQELDARVRGAFLRFLSTWQKGGRERLELMRWLVTLHTVPLSIYRGKLDLGMARREFAASNLRLLGSRLREWE